MSTQTANSARLKLIVVLSVLGLFSSFYLIENHYAGINAGSGCDINSFISCSLVNNSVYSTLFKIPVAILGAIWMVGLGVLALINMQHEKKRKSSDIALPSILFYYTLSGMLFVVYLIIAEVLLRAICPVCTLVHIITFICFVLSWMMLRIDVE